MTVLQRAWSRLRGEEGYSLIELVVTVAILGTVLAAITTLFVSGSKAELDMNRRFQAQQDARIALSTIRNDIHVARCAATAAGSLSLYTSVTGDPASPVRASCTGSAVTVWCAYLVTSAPLTRYDLYRIPAATCPATETSAKSSGKLETDYLTTNALFSDPGASNGQQQSITVTLPVATGTAKTPDKYTLADTIVLRNSPRTP